MARGGSRPGAGRPKGAANKLSQEVAARLAANGDTPLEALAELRRWAMDQFRQSLEGDEPDFDKAAKAAEVAADWAAKEAPYMHPRLQAIEADIRGELTYEERLRRLVGDGG